MGVTIHSTAVVEPGAQLGKDVTIGAFAYIDEKVQIGDGCTIGPHATILRYTELGIGCRVHAGAVLGDVPQDYAYQGSKSFVKIGAHSVLREGVTIHRGSKPETCTEVGQNCLLMAFSHVAHNAKIGSYVTIANGALLAGYVAVDDKAFISGNCLVHQFTRVGRLAMMSGGSASQKDIPPFCITRSMSSNTVMGLNIVGLKRAGIEAEERLILKRAFKVLYQSNLTVSEAVAHLEQETTSALVMELCQFIKLSERGICKFIRHNQID